MSLVTRCPLIAPQLMRPAEAGVRIVLKCWVAVFAAHGPTSCFSPTRTGVLADLSRCKPLPGIAVNGALYGDRSPQRSPGAHQVPWLAPIMLVTGGWGARLSDN
jgi:hypothetical protein